jgi:hypothetical protein
MAVLIHGTPPIVAFAVDREKDLIEVLLIAWSGASATRGIRIHLPELPAPAAHGFMGQDDAACGHEFPRHPGSLGKSGSTARRRG